MPTARWTCSLPLWLFALIAALLTASLCLYAGIHLHTAALNKSLERTVEKALSEAVGELDLILDQALSTLATIEPLTGQGCSAPILATMRSETDLRPYLRSAFIVHDDTRACGTYFGLHTNRFNASAPRRDGLWLRASDSLAPLASSLVYSLFRPPYTINTSVHGEAVARPLRRSGDTIDLLLQVGAMQLDEAAQVWESDQTLALLMHRVHSSSRHDYAVHGGMPAQQREAVHQRELRSVLGSLLVAAGVVGGLVFTGLYNGRRRECVRH